jgi:hypothetical protein
MVLIKISGCLHVGLIMIVDLLNDPDPKDMAECKQCSD